MQSFFIQRKNLKTRYKIRFLYILLPFNEFCARLIAKSVFLVYNCFSQAGLKPRQALKLDRKTVRS